MDSTTISLLWLPFSRIWQKDVVKHSLHYIHTTHRACSIYDNCVFRARTSASTSMRLQTAIEDHRREAACLDTMCCAVATVLC